MNKEQESLISIVDFLEETIEDTKAIPFVHKAFYDKNELLEIVEQIRLRYPEELKQAQYVIENRQKILDEAQREADEIIRKTADKVNLMLNDHEITRKANEKAAEIMENAQNESRSMRLATKEYVAKNLNELENTISAALQKVRDDKRTIN